MENQIFQEVIPEEREASIRAIADQVVNETFSREYTPDEILILKDDFANLNIRLNELEEKFKEVKADWADQIKGVKKDCQKMLKAIHEGYEMVTEDLYKMIDHENGNVAFYDKTGKLIRSRRIKPEERQRDIFQVNRNAKIS